MSPTKRPSSVAGLRRAVAAPPAAAPAVTAAPMQVPARRPRPEKPIRFTLDLGRDDHQFLKRYAGETEANGAEVMRALLAELRNDPDLAGRVRERIWETR